MEPFSITCHSCAVRLKVDRAELIDQTLACPKCGSMIHVQHPTGWKPPIPESASQSALSSVVGGHDFEKIEDLLPKPGESAWKDKAPTDRTNKAAAGRAKPKSQTPQRPQASQSSDKARFQNPVPSTGAAASSKQPREDSLGTQPIMPGQQWSSHSSQQRRKLMLMIGSAIGTVLLVAFAIAAIVRFGGDTPEEPGQVVIADPVTEKIEDDSSLPDTNVDDTDSLTDDGSTKVSDNSKDESNGFLDNSPTVGQLPIEQNDAFGTPPPVTSSDASSGFARPDLVVEDPKPNAAADLTDGNPENPVDEVRNAKPVRSRSLQELLGDAGISVDELEDVAVLLRSYEDSSNPKFSVVPPRIKKANFQRLLGLPIRKLDNPAGISLASAARTLSQLSGVPIAIDARQLSLMGLPVNPTLKLSLADETTLSAVEKIAQLAGAKASVVGGGLVISVPAQQSNSEFKVAFPTVGNLNEEEKNGFVKSIQALIEPDVWTRNIEPSTIRVDGETIVLNCSPAVGRRVQMLVDLMNAAFELTSDPKNENAATIVVSRWSASEGLRTQPTAWSIGPDQSLAGFLDRIERLHGLTVTVDWPSVLEAGWTPLTMVPGELVEAEVGDAINQLAKAMNLKVIGIDAKTLQLTTPAVLGEMRDLEVFPLLANWAAEVDPEEIEQLIFKALGRQVQASFVRVIFEPKCRCLIVVAPQSIQHQIGKLVELLNRVEAAADDDR